MWSRRHFLERGLQLGSLAALAQAFPAYAADKISGGNPSYPFTLGVASGSPRQDSVVLWTRLLPGQLNSLLLPLCLIKSVGSWLRMRHLSVSSVKAKRSPYLSWRIVFMLM